MEFKIPFSISIAYTKGECTILGNFDSFGNKGSLSAEADDRQKAFSFKEYPLNADFYHSVPLWLTERCY